MAISLEREDLRLLASRIAESITTMTQRAVQAHEDA